MSVSGRAKKSNWIDGQCTESTIDTKQVDHHDLDDNDDHDDHDDHKDVHDDGHENLFYDHVEKSSRLQ